MRYIPVAEYEIGICYYGYKEPYRTVLFVCADSLDTAMKSGREILKPNAIQHIVHVATRPNPEYVQYREQLANGGDL